MDEGPNTAHLKWAIEQRAEIQFTLLALYDYMRSQPEGCFPDWFQELFQDHLIAAGFSLWRAVFLGDKPRDLKPVLDAQKAFLAKVLSTNAITFADDQKNSPWAVTFYLENARLRLLEARGLALELRRTVDSMALPTPSLDLVDYGLVERLVLYRGRRVLDLQYQWELAHSALRRLFRVLEPTTTLPVKDLALPIDLQHA